MKRIGVYKYEIWGSVCEWPVEVDLSRREASGTWTLYFRYVDPEARHAENVSACDAQEVREVLVEHNASAVEFSSALLRAAEGLDSELQRSNLIALARDLHGLSRAETDGR